MHGAPYFEVSSVTGSHVAEAIDEGDCLNPFPPCESHFIGVQFPKQEGAVRIFDVLADMEF
jgi:hypothetical protein